MYNKNEMNYLEKNKEQYLKELKKLISIQSYLRNPKQYPTKEIIEALSFMDGLGKKEGFKTYVDPAGYYGYIEIGKGKELIGILGHLDVVPPGTNMSKWDTPPFELTIEGDNLKGRGVQDDKGPVLLSFYLMKEIAELNPQLNKRIRLIMPTDEESFWRGIKKYKDDGNEIPIYGITPDSTFPVTYSERELWEFRIKGKTTEDFKIKAGGSLNIVPDEANYSDNNGKLISTEGKAAHAMEPWKGENAICKLAIKLENINHELIKFVNNEINSETNGDTLFGKHIEDDDSEIALNLAVMTINSTKAEILIDIRIPNTSNHKELKELVLKKLESYKELEFEEYDLLQGVFMAKDSDLITKLMDSYKEVTGSDEVPLSSGGATYARSMDNIVAFGPFFSYTKITEHQYNEVASWKDYLKAYDIYNNLFNKLIK